MVAALLNLHTCMSKHKIDLLNRGKEDLDVHQRKNLVRRMEAFQNDVSAQEALTHVRPSMLCETIVKTFYLACHACHSTIESSVFRLACEKSSTSKKWSCRRHKSWTFCDHHATTEFSCKKPMALKRRNLATLPDRITPRNAKFVDLYGRRCGDLVNCQCHDS